MPESRLQNQVELPAEGRAEGFHRSRRGGARGGRTKRRASPAAAGMPRPMLECEVGVARLEPIGSGC